ncbi:hypothetical protein V1508DRAFT_438604 [Lipomyces doorenjongii]|uniref:uncharacterized protein n=1 Tax=Lipomyces doorenjongii TaxID=383834 RepID=UPI0034CFDB7B
MAVPKITGMMRRRVTRDIVTAFSLGTAITGYYCVLLADIHHIHICSHPFSAHVPYIGRLKQEEPDAAELRKLKPYLYGYPSPPKPDSWPPYPAFPA